MEDRLPRKLAAILYADVAGYSRLTGEDEDATHRTLSEYLDLIASTIGSHGGQVMHYAGDAVLAKFDAVVDALSSAVSIQNELETRNEDLPNERKVQFRIGVNLGDVIEDRGDIYGDGVNVAARLESLADEGGICISESVRTAIGKKLDLGYEFMGEQQVKNIEEPVRAYKVALGSEEKTQVSSPEKPALALPDKPSIAVLPFTNMSGDPEQEFFADGISEDIITELSKFHSLFVIARNSSFVFKGQSIDVKDVSSKLGVCYVVEGSVRRAGNRVRISAQLIDAVGDKHIWAERYDRDLEDIFVVQDEVTHAIVSTIEPQLASTERQRARRKPTDNLDAWECYQRALWYLYQFTPEDCGTALKFIERAVNLDPTFASAHAGLAFVLYYNVLMEFSKDREGDLRRALDAGKRAVALDENDPFAHVALGRVHTIKGEPDTAVAACDRAISLNPSYANAHFGRAHSLWHAGRAAEALASLDEAMRLSPRDPIMWAFMASKAIALIMLRRHDEALDWAQRAERQPNAGTFAYVAEVSALGLLDRSDEARAALKRLHQHNPDVSIAFVNRALPITHATDREHFHSGLIKAGLPE